MKHILAIVKILLFLPVIFVVLRALFPYYQVASNSMEPTFHKGSILITSRYYYSFSKPNRGDIVLIKPASDASATEILAHRIIAIGGDLVTIKNNEVYVNNTKIMFSRINNSPDQLIYVLTDYIFQKGDSSNTTTYGIINKNRLMGKVLFYF